jgi:phenylpropionate dioxygenase-like ring-hydroxylating dioxygenase large terminal subunit
MKFLENFWYAAAWSEEITGQPLARRILDRPVALFRTESGKAAAFDDCCPHRMVPLSRGRVEGESLRCGYHGLRFDCSGKCAEVPGQVNIPPRAKVNSYALVERWKFAWIWMGDAALANPDLIPELPWLDSKEWAYSHGCIVYDCNYALLLDNLIDLSHTTFVHQGTIGTEDVAKTPVKTTSDARRVLVERIMEHTEPSIMYKRAGGFTGKVDRWQKIEYTAPTNIIIDAGAVPAGTGDAKRGIGTRIINIITPQTPASCFHFWAFARDFKLDDPAMTQYLGDAVTLTFNEDKALIDGQQRNVDARPQQRMLDNNADSGVVLARRIVERLLGEEAGRL